LQNTPRKMKEQNVTGIGSALRGTETDSGVRGDLMMKVKEKKRIGKSQHGNSVSHWKRIPHLHVSGN